MPATRHKRWSLNRAIDHLDEDQLRRTLFTLSYSSTDCANAVSKLLLGHEHVPGHEKTPNRQEEVENQGPATKKRKKDDEDGAEEVEEQPAHKECRLCHETFDVAKNAIGDCKLQIDPDEFDDDDEVHKWGCVNIDMETDERRDEVPEGFVWSCCNATLADDPACLKGRHVAVASA